MTETWRAVAGYEGSYEVSDEGRVRSWVRVVASRFGRTRKPRGKELKPYFDRDGYSVARLSVNGNWRLLKVHHLVAEAFIGLRPVGLQINHKNGMRDDNHPRNLEWVTASQNTQHSYRVLGRKPPCGEEHYNAKLTVASVDVIRSRYESGSVTQRELAEEYGVRRSNIGHIIRGNTWKHTREGEVIT